MTDVEGVVGATQNVYEPHPDDDAIVQAGTRVRVALRLAGFAGSLRAFSQRWLAMSEPRLAGRRDGGESNGGEGGIRSGRSFLGQRFRPVSKRRILSNHSKSAYQVQTGTAKKLFSDPYCNRSRDRVVGNLRPCDSTGEVVDEHLTSWHARDPVGAPRPAKSAKRSAAKNKFGRRTPDN